jgi:hypothetical protein
MQLKRLDRFKVPLTGQQIELHQVDYDGGGMSQLRILIRERTRFTTIDVDPVTAKYWGVALCRWAEKQAGLPDGSANSGASAAVGKDAARIDE